MAVDRYSVAATLDYLQAVHTELVEMHEPIPMTVLLHDSDFRFEIIAGISHGRAANASARAIATQVQDRVDLIG